jgi:hypothetical protein
MAIALAGAVVSKRLGPGFRAARAVRRLGDFFQQRLEARGVLQPREGAVAAGQLDVAPPLGLSFRLEGGAKAFQRRLVLPQQRLGAGQVVVSVRERLAVVGDLAAGGACPQEELFGPCVLLALGVN